MVIGKGPYLCRKLALPERLCLDSETRPDTLALPGFSGDETQIRSSRLNPFPPKELLRAMLGESRPPDCKRKKCQSCMGNQSAKSFAKPSSAAASAAATSPIAVNPVARSSGFFRENNNKRMV